MSGPLPAIRRTIAAEADSGDGVILYDRARMGGPPVRVSRGALEVARRLDGSRSADDIARELGAAVGDVSAVVQALDAALYLASPRWDAFVNAPVREPVATAGYAGDPHALRQQLNGLFTAEGGPGLPGEPGCRVADEGPVRAVLVPHMDYARGGVAYAWAMKEFVERTDARLIAIVGTSHYSPARFSLTRKHFRTPLGTATTDIVGVDRLADLFGPGVWADPLAHLPEHSIELEVALLQNLLDGRRAFRVLPLLTGSLYDCVRERGDPLSRPDVGHMVACLKQWEAEAGEPVAYLISGDLAHIGPKFDRGDPPLDAATLAASRAADERSLAALCEGWRGFWELIAGEGDRRNVCGLSPLVTALAACGPVTGRVMGYTQYREPRGHESVSFAAVAFS